MYDQLILRHACLELGKCFLQELFLYWHQPMIENIDSTEINLIRTETAIKAQPAYAHDPKWAIGVSCLIKAQMAASGMTYADLSKKLKEVGTTQSSEN